MVQSIESFSKCLLSALLMVSPYAKRSKCRNGELFWDEKYFYGIVLTYCFLVGSYLISQLPPKRNFLSSNWKKKWRGVNFFLPYERYEVSNYNRFGNLKILVKFHDARVYQHANRQVRVWVDKCNRFQPNSYD